jgi:glycolate oxidase FAD binding subunit
MVVKNVAGLDMGKLMIGSFGTLAAVASVNFKLTPMPPVTRTFLMRFSQLEKAMAKRDAIQRGVLQPVSLDLLNPHAAARLGLEGWLLLLQAAGSEKVIGRYTRELDDADTLDGDAEQSLWETVREFVPHFLAEHERGSVVRVSTTLEKVAEVAAHAPAPLLCRAGNGVSYLCFPDAEGASAWLQQGVARGWRGVIESAPPFSCAPDRQWPAVGSELAVMEKIKRMMDAHNLLNPGRLYGRI